MIGETIVNVAHEFTIEELDYLVLNQVELVAIRELLGNTNADMTLDAAIGGVKNVAAAAVEGKQVADPSPE